MLTETAAPLVGQSLIDELADHLKLSTGFGSDAEDELEGSLRAAIAHLEARLGLALIQRNFIWRGGVGADGVRGSGLNGSRRQPGTRAGAGVGVRDGVGAGADAAVPAAPVVKASLTTAGDSRAQALSARPRTSPVKSQRRSTLSASGELSHQKVPTASNSLPRTATKSKEVNGNTSSKPRTPSARTATATNAIVQASLWNPMTTSAPRDTKASASSGTWKNLRARARYYLYCARVRARARACTDRARAKVCSSCHTLKKAVDFRGD